MSEPVHGGMLVIDFNTHIDTAKLPELAFHTMVALGRPGGLDKQLKTICTHISICIEPQASKVSAAFVIILTPTHSAGTNGCGQD